MEEENLEAVEQEVVETAPVEPVEQVAEAQQNINFRELREAKARLERENEELRMKYEQKPEPKPDPEDYSTGDDDDFVELRHVKAIRNEMAEMKKARAEEKRVMIQEQQRLNLRNRFKDFDSIVNDENIHKFEQIDPDMADALSSSGASIDKIGAAIYKRIKELGIAVQDNSVSDRLKVKDNSSKPRPMTSISPKEGGSPLSNANAFQDDTPEYREFLNKQMEDAINNG